jgi:hypothetical protein
MDTMDTIDQEITSWPLYPGLVEEKEDEKKKEKSPGSVSILQLFKFASPLDITLLLLGTLAGTKQPCMCHPVQFVPIS